jgi:hypothetical protein
VRIALLADELERLETSQQARDVWVGGDHAAADGGAGQPLRMRTAQNPEHVVLRRGDAPVADLQMEGAIEAV